MSSKGRTSRTEILFDESHPDDVIKPESEELYEDARPLGEELIDTLIDLLFFAGLTLPHTDQSKKKVTYSIWQSGVGCNTSLSSSKEMESNRTEILRLLLTLSSKSLYMPASEFYNNLRCNEITYEDQMFFPSKVLKLSHTLRPARTSRWFFHCSAPY